MIRLLFSAFILFSSIQLGYSQHVESKLVWLSNLEQAKEVSSNQNRPILMRFEGSDWCANCWRLDASLFKTEAFSKYASENLVLLSLDFPQKKENQLPAKQAELNKKLLKEYNTRGIFPMVVLLDNAGSVLGQMSVAPNQAEAYINQLKSIVSRASN